MRVAVVLAAELAAQIVARGSRRRAPLRAPAPARSTEREQRWERGRPSHRAATISGPRASRQLRDGGFSRRRPTPTVEMRADRSVARAPERAAPWPAYPGAGRAPSAPPAAAPSTAGRSAPAPPRRCGEPEPRRSGRARREPEAAEEVPRGVGGVAGRAHGRAVTGRGPPSGYWSKPVRGDWRLRGGPGGRIEADVLLAARRIARRQPPPRALERRERIVLELAGAPVQLAPPAHLIDARLQRDRLRLGAARLVGQDVGLGLQLGRSVGRVGHRLGSHGRVPAPPARGPTAASVRALICASSSVSRRASASASARRARST